MGEGPGVGKGPGVGEGVGGTPEQIHCMQPYLSPAEKMGHSGGKSGVAQLVGL